LTGVASGHLKRDILPRRADLAALGADMADHLRLRFHRGRSYGPLQKLSYALVLLALFPLMILTGLAMSPGMNAAVPFLADMFGGRQTARTLHFLGMALILLFFIVHIVMVALAGPFNEMRSMVTGWYRAEDVRASKRKGESQ
jgi:thiosulfate reductase cytochrome b subunit